MLGVTCLVVTRGAMVYRVCSRAGGLRLSLSRLRYRLSALYVLQPAYLTLDIVTHADHTTGRL